MRLYNSIITYEKQRNETVRRIGGVPYWLLSHCSEMNNVDQTLRAASLLECHLHLHWVWACNMGQIQVFS